MKCEQVSDLVSRYVDGDLPPGEAEAVRGHIAGCAVCRMEMAAEQAAVKALASPVMNFDAPNVLAQVRGRVAEPRRQLVRPRWQWAIAGLAAACCLIGFEASLTRDDVSPETAMNLTTVEESAPVPHTPVPPVVRPGTDAPSAGPVEMTVESRKTAVSAKPILVRNKPKPRRPDMRHVPSPAPASGRVAPEPEIEYLVVYNHSGLGDGMGTGDADVDGSAGSEAPTASVYSISMTDESTGAVTNVSAYTNSDGESEESATVEFRSESATPDADGRERSSTDEKPLRFADGAAHSNMC